MPRYFMRDTPLQAMEQLMMSQPGQKPRGGGIYRRPFHYTPKDVACKYCQNYDRKHSCRLYTATTYRSPTGVRRLRLLLLRWIRICMNWNPRAPIWPTSPTGPGRKSAAVTGYSVRRMLRISRRQRMNWRLTPEKCGPSFSPCGGRILDEQTLLKERRSGILADNKEQAKANQRIMDAAQTLENASPHITEWDESAVRQLVETVKILSKDEVAVTLKGGIEICQKIMY